MSKSSVNHRSTAPPEGQGKEQRRTPRFKLKTGVQWRPAGVVSGEWMRGTVVDLSVAGAAFLTEAALEEGDQISMKIEPPSAMETVGRSSLSPVLVRAVVRNRRPTESPLVRFGVEFERMYFMFGEWARMLHAAEDNNSTEEEA